jgi:hypothetical protein
MMKGPISDQVTEKCCGCFLALTIVSQWMRVGAVWCGLLRRVRQSCAAEGGRVRCRRTRLQVCTCARVHVQRELWMVYVDDSTAACHDASCCCAVKMEGSIAVCEELL